MTSLRFEVRHRLEPAKPSLSAGRVYGTFGLEPEMGDRVYVEPFTLDVRLGQIVAFVGASGAGKSSCLQQFAAQMHAHDLASEPLDPSAAVIDELMSHEGARWEMHTTPQRAMEVAGACGMAEAQLLLRRCSELSDGQRYRFGLAKGILRSAPALICDEFLSNLDRTTAKTVAFNMRKMVTRGPLILGVATTHEDILEDLSPDHLVTFDGTTAKVVVGGPKARPSHSTGGLPLREALARTGRGSPSGTTGGTPSD